MTEPNYWSENSQPTSSSRSPASSSSTCTSPILREQMQELLLQNKQQVRPQIDCSQPAESSALRSRSSIGSNDVVQAKLVLLGDLGTRKTSLVVRFAKGLYYECQESTIGAAFFSQVLALDAATVKLDIWEAAGQERYHSLAPMYYRAAAAAIVVFDISREDSYIRAKRWVDELQRQGNPHLVMALVGNKLDLEEKRKVGTQEAMEYAEANGFFFLETSAKTAQNVSELFYELAERLVKLRPNRPAGMFLRDGQRGRVGGRWRFCCSS